MRSDQLLINEKIRDAVNAIFDNIRDEIKTMSGDIETIADVLQIIDKYR